MAPPIVGTDGDIRHTIHGVCRRESIVKTMHIGSGYLRFEYSVML